MASETPNTQAPFRSLLLAVDCLLPSGKAILSGAGHKRYLSAFLKSTAFPDFTDQDMILGMMLRFTCKMDVSLLIFIFIVLPVLVNSFRLFLFVWLWIDVTPLTRRSFIKQSLGSIPVFLIFSNSSTWLLSSTGPPKLMLYNSWVSKSGLKGLR